MWRWILAWWSPQQEIPGQTELGADGAELFRRVWVADDPRSVAGDGLGPTYNAQSCVACHQQGGAGGAGAQHSNVQLALVDGQTHVRHRVGNVAPQELQLLSTSTRMPFRSRSPERNTPALWGAGQLDAIPEAELYAVALAGDPDHPEISGRVARDELGRAGRFGWKGQTATLAGFVEAACANELGLETALVSQPGAAAPGPDLSDEQLVALTGFVSALPRPLERETPGRALGRQRFEELGCTGCHRASLGGVDGLYSDLLLHDMGPLLADATSSYAGRQEAKPVHDHAAHAREWRTPPLWGLADSAPYLHDGSASNVRDAVLRHAGEAELVKEAFLALPAEQQLELETFLLTLSAP